MDNYVLVERLGQGAYAVVWKARRRSDNRLVAAKQLRQAPATWEECKRLPEIRSAASCRSPHIISLLEVVRASSELFLVFEHADSDLYRCLGPSHRFAEAQVRWAIRQLLNAIAVVHSAGFVHCDIKPENLLLFARGGPCNSPILKLCDFGQATPSGEVQSYVGTRWYRPPELLLGCENAGREIDLWAAGCTMVELLITRPPFPGSDTRDMLFKICSALGAPDSGWHLGQRLVEASGLRFAPRAEQGPLWPEIESLGASPSAVELARGFLRYEEGQRWSAQRALGSAFFAFSAPEIPVTPPESVGRPKTPERLLRQREEAKKVERKLQAETAARTGTSTGVSTGPSFTGPQRQLQAADTTSLWPLGWERRAMQGSMGTIAPSGMAVPQRPRQMATSASTPSLFNGGATSSSSSSTAMGGWACFSSSTKDDWEPPAAAWLDTSPPKGEEGSFMRPSSAATSTSPPKDVRIAGKFGIDVLRPSKKPMPPSSSPLRFVAEPDEGEGMRPYSKSAHRKGNMHSSCSERTLPRPVEIVHEMDDEEAEAEHASSSQLHVAQQSAPGDDEELAALFWSQVENDRAGTAGGVPSAASVVRHAGLESEGHGGSTKQKRRRPRRGDAAWEADAFQEPWRPPCQTGTVVRSSGGVMAPSHGSQDVGQAAERAHSHSSAAPPDSFDPSDLLDAIGDPTSGSGDDVSLSTHGYIHSMHPTA
eukprot:gnl/TRDRNA2_/TRDRNA2_133380_c0_seq1.p1 gnl/TRDRNA2_/TRDRNA2_133380_c0~~gnl/TRDRNA2_/TRDRNA2_133380_c0_seq1.p1  ORF type:complete len:708 (-),score=98.22 gnl/TRDRNA2_/TRDRNA2_133380_c0_seq1:110-2233(-)